MSAPIRAAARALYDLRRQGDDVFAAACAELDDGDLSDLLTCWQLYAHDGQVRPADGKPIWLVQAGRGFGKTRCAAEDTLDVVEDWGPKFRGIFCSKTIGDVRDVMIEGESGLIACAARRGYEVRYVSNRAIVEFPQGGVAHVLSSEKPEKPRGYQSNFLWGDEISSWMNATRTWNNLMLGWRLPTPPGTRPLAVVTTTPKPNEIMMLLARSEEYRGKVTITRGKMRANQANLAPDVVDLFESIYKGTKLGLQELDGELLDGFAGVIDQDTIHAFRRDAYPELARRIVSLDPSITAREDSDAAGIIVLGSDKQPTPHAYVIDDRTLEAATFRMWAEASVLAFVGWNCDCIVAEVNQGGGGIAEAIEVAAEKIGSLLGVEIVAPVRSVWARESKQARAEPVGSLYERGRIHHVGHFRELEKELTQWIPGSKSPNRMDALVHGVTHLLLADTSGSASLSAYLKTI